MVSAEIIANVIIDCEIEKKCNTHFLICFIVFLVRYTILKKMIHKTKFVSKKVKNRCYKIFISTTWATPSSSFERVTL